MKAKHTIGIKRYLEGAEDAHGNPIEGWGPEEPVKVFAIVPTSSVEPTAVGREAVITGLSILAPSSVQVSHKDRILIGSEEFTIEGEVADWTRGPFSFKPGIQFALKRVEG
jgi:hypothetical protein